MRVAVEQVVQTATRVLDGQLAPREAVTILATLARDAVPAARQLREAEPERADTCRELLVVVRDELQRRGEGGGERHLRAVIDDLERVLRALQ